MSSVKKFYAVKKGRSPGIYTIWAGKDGAQIQVQGFPGAVYKGFKTRKEAEAFMAGPMPEWTFKNTKKQELKYDKTDNTVPVPDLIETGKSAGKQILIYTDGGAIGNPGPGGYGIVIINGKDKKEISGGFRLTTNNRMELTACIQALKSLKKPSKIELFSDSKYVVNGISKGWAKRWRKNNWMRTETEPAVNADLWEQLLEQCEKHSVNLNWVKGHAGNLYNERCDQLVRAESSKKGLPPDLNYENL
ncbi:Ribonuclease H [Desulfonema limicola]|uniref:Ribonuclease H n=1 Tax=Desulfonema limicola TaxID=45656 RepID=A0A975B614_9BACT|nr:ribonuclease HI [Desulfonema limicola]QTA79471.1 Ribonuclease H [Desulfonema limicola]